MWLFMPKHHFCFCSSAILEVFGQGMFRAYNCLFLFSALDSISLLSSPCRFRLPLVDEGGGGVGWFWPRVGSQLRSPLTQIGGTSLADGSFMVARDTL